MDSLSATDRFLLERMAVLRTKLLDLTLRNRLINFRHSKGAGKFLRVIDELPDALAARLDEGASMLLEGVPEGKQRRSAEDDKLDGAMKTAMLTEEKYIQAISELRQRGDDGPSEREMERLESELRTRVAETMGIKAKAKPTLEQLAEVAGIDPAVDLPEQLPAGAEGPRSEKYKDRKIRIRLTEPELDVAATGLFRENRLSIEERGVNNLFMCFGFLEWYESDASEKVICSPLLLHQISLSRELRGGRYVYTSTSTGEGLVLNVTLGERVKRDFGLVLPEIGEEQTPEMYFADVAKLIADRKTWRVRRWVTLAPLAFAKIAMFRDLDPATWSAASQPIDQLGPVRLVLAGQRTGEMDAERSSVFSAPDLDTEQHPLAERVACVADADSSQVSAILDVLGGKHLVIEGPPGTGKSQTITNIIATALCEGKTVLFVAEKMAALEVVQSRLTGAGLGAFCLELHSGGKAAAIELLKKRLELQAPVRSQSAELDFQRKSEMDRLRATVLALHLPYGAMGLSAYELVWRVQATRDAAPGVDVRLEDVPVGGAANIGPVALGKVLADVTALGVLLLREAEVFGVNLAESSGTAGVTIGEGPAATGNPWSAMADPDLSNLVLGDMVRVTGQLHAEVQSLRAVAERVGGLTGDEIANLEACEALAIAAAAIQAAPSGLDPRLLAMMGDAELRPLAREFVDACAQRGVLHASVAGAFANSQYAETTSPERIDAAATLAEMAGADGVTVSQLAGFASSVQADADAVRATLHALGNIAQAIGLRAVDGESMPVVAGLVRCCATLSDGAIGGRAVGLLDADAVRPVAEAGKEAARLLAERAMVAAWLRVDDGADAGAMLIAANALKSAGALSFLSGGYRAARAMYAQLAVDPTEKLTAPQQGVRLERLALMLRDTRRLDDDSRLKLLLGKLFDGVRTDFARAGEITMWAEAVRGAISPLHPDAGRLRGAVLEANDDTLRRLVAMCRTVDWQRLDAIASGVAAGRPASDFAAAFASRAAAASELAGLCAQLGFAGTVSVSTLRTLAADRSRLIAMEGVLRSAGPLESAMGDQFRGEATDTAPLRSAIGHFDALVGGGFTPVVAGWLCSADVTGRRAALASDGAELGRACRGVREELRSLARLATGGRLNEQSAFGGVAGQVRIREFAARLGGAVAHADGLQRLVDILRLQRELAGAGLGEVLVRAERLRVTPEDLATAVERAVLVTVLREAVDSKPPLRTFSGSAFAELRAQFAKLDRQWIVSQRMRVLAAAASRNPPAGISGPRVADKTELALISHELTKRRGYLSMRSLLRRSGASVQMLCPCFMMSPLSVAESLDPAGLKFDLLVIDEASQLRPQEAIGAIARAKQIVIVGDPKQLPPTSFFESAAGEQTEEDEESILDQAMKQISPPRRLKWHYRSRHQSLIAFSNRQFYDNELVVFPSPDYAVGHSGLHAVRVEGGVYAASMNQVEARRVIEAAVKHATESPEQTLGMVAMNKQQADLMADLWDAAVAADPVAAAFVARHAATLEPVFVKNLENVQGDERDVLLISTVYGPDANGAFFQRFGPINNAGGQRRLNVLFTRSKRQMTIFTSMDPDKIAANDGQSGPAALKGMLTYALRGQLEIGAAIANAATESPFEQAVLQRLRAKGLIATPQVGVAGYRIDIGLADPAKPGRFVLGVECDGATYHSAKSVRDRDRLRQEVLERLGWKIHRIWSLDWWKTPDQEFERMLRAYEEARKGG